MSNFYFDTGTVGDASAASAATYDFWSAVDARMANNVSWEVEDDVPLFTNPETIAGWETTPGGTGAGALSDEMLPIASQGLISWSTGVVFNNRRVRGRTFIPGLTQDANEDGRLGIATITALNPALAPLVGSGLVIASRRSGTFVPVVSGSIWGQFAVLRSRRD